MKKRILALVLAAIMLGCTGCSQLLERGYSSVEKHYEQYVELDESSAIEVSDARSLESAIVYFVRQGAEMGTVRTRDYEGSITDDLTRICLSIQDDALGAYAVEYISHEKLSMVSYSEINIYFTYKKTPEQIECLEDMSYYNLGQAMNSLFATGGEYAAFYISYLPIGDKEVYQLAQDASNLAGITGKADYSVTLYPDSGLRRVVELTVDYGAAPEVSHNMRMLLDQRTDEIIKDAEKKHIEETVEAYTEILSGMCTIDDDGGSSAYDAVVTGTADSLGFARGVMYLCYRSGINCAIVQNEYSGEYVCYNPENGEIVFQGEVEEDVE